MLAGEPPYTGPTAQAIIAKRMLEPVPRIRTVRESVPQELEQCHHPVARQDAGRPVRHGARVRGRALPNDGQRAGACAHVAIGRRWRTAADAGRRSRRGRSCPSSLVRAIRSERQSFSVTHRGPALHAERVRHRAFPAGARPGVYAERGAGRPGRHPCGGRPHRARPVETGRTRPLPPKERRWPAGSARAASCMAVSCEKAPMCAWTSSCARPTAAPPHWLARPSPEPPIQSLRSPTPLSTFSCDRSGLGDLPLLLASRRHSRPARFRRCAHSSKGNDRSSAVGGTAHRPHTVAPGKRILPSGWPMPARTMPGTGR